MANVRIFVCQQCGTAVSVLYGRSIICRCGAKSSATIEVSPKTARILDHAVVRFGPVLKRLADR